MTPDGRRSHEPLADLLLEQMGFLRRLARGLVWGGDQAEDVVQEAVAIALHHAPRDRSSLRSWLSRITRNVAHRAHRGDARRRHREQQAEEPATVASTAEVVARQELFLRLGEAVRGLPEPYRSAIHHRYYDDLKPAEIARQQALPVATVRTRLRRGLQILRESLDLHHNGDRRAWCLPLVPLSGRCEPMQTTSIYSTRRDPERHAITRRAARSTSP